MNTRCLFTAATMLALAGAEKSAAEITMASYFYGPSAGTDDNPSSLRVQNQLGLRYPLSDSLILTPTFDFEYLITDPSAANSDSRFLLGNDSFFQFYRPEIAMVRGGEGTFDVDGELRVYVPSSSLSRENSTIGSISIGINPTIRIHQSHFWVSSSSSLRYWLQTRETSRSDADLTLPRFDLYSNIAVNHQLNETATIWLLYETYLTIDARGVPDTSNPRIPHFDLEPGVDFKLAPGLFLSPYLNWYTNQGLKTVSFNLNASFTI